MYSNAKIAAQKIPPQPTAAPDPGTFSQEKLLEVRLVVPPPASEKEKVLGQGIKDCGVFSYYEGLRKTCSADKDSAGVDACHSLRSRTPESISKFNFALYYQ